jgi:hypothetical protein
MKNESVWDVSQLGDETITYHNNRQDMGYD